MSRPKLKPRKVEPEPEELVLVRVETCKLFGRIVRRGDLVKVAPGKVDPKGFKAMFMYAYVVEGTGEVDEVTVYGGLGYAHEKQPHEQGETAFRTFVPERVTALRGDITLDSVR